MKRLDIHQTARVALLAAAIGGPGAAAADAATDYQLKPRVRPGDIVIQRRVEAAPLNRVERHGGPITSRQNARITVQEQLSGIDAVSLTDERAAGVRGSVQNSLAPLHRTLGTGSRQPGARSNRAASSLGGGSTGGGSGGIAGQVTSATSGISGTVGRALSPLTGRD
ncbi:MAG: hypothetical protein L0J54_09745 [Halomonas sp.]|nr:hypothetical protein [Halomonas sp.]MDN6298289.1 hypothetical protein [Halomonas sp.]MDN6315534.1 hypothetical protein [Halomonas sp.]MDN6336889.1 hypothetical protein [Halomonas sp.]